MLISAFTISATFNPCASTTCLYGNVCKVVNNQAVCVPKSNTNTSPGNCICTAHVDEVCGINGQTYSNMCRLNCAKKEDKCLMLAYRGACPGGPRPVPRPLPRPLPRPPIFPRFGRGGGGSSSSSNGGRFGGRYGKGSSSSGGRKGYRKYYTKFLKNFYGGKGKSNYKYNYNYKNTYPNPNTYYTQSY